MGSSSRSRSSESLHPFVRVHAHATSAAQDHRKPARKRRPHSGGAHIYALRFSHQSTPTCRFCPQVGSRAYLYSPSPLKFGGLYGFNDHYGTPGSTWFCPKFMRYCECPRVRGRSLLSSSLKG